MSVQADRIAGFTLTHTLQEKSESGSGKSSLTNSNICMPVFSGPQQPAMPSTTVTSGDSRNVTVLCILSVKVQNCCAALQCSSLHDQVDLCLALRPY